MLKHIILASSAALLLVGCQEAFDRQLQREAEESTRLHHPVKISDEISEDSIVYNPQTRVLTYYHTLSGSLDQKQYSVIEQTTLKKQYVSAVRSSVELQQAKEQGITFSYVYLNATQHKHVIQFNITPEDYNAPAQ